MKNSEMYIAQLNIARMIGTDINDPIMQDFIAQLNTINALAEKSDGFIWRLKDEGDNATAYNPYNDDRLIINFSVWQTAELLKDFVYKSLHVHVMKDRKRWFEKFGKAYYVLWNIPAGHIPSLDEAVERLAYLQEHGSSEFAFDFSNGR